MTGVREARQRERVPDVGNVAYTEAPQGDSALVRPPLSFIVL